MGRVMSIDDDEAVRSIVETVLKMDGHEVVGAADGEAALRLMSVGLAPSVVLLDLMMPRVSGWDVLAAMARLPALEKVPVLVLTALDDASDLPPKYHVLHKPVEADVLRERVRELEG